MNRIIVVGISLTCVGLVATATAQVPPSPRPASQTAPAANPSAAEPGYLGTVLNDSQENGAGVRIVEIETGGPAEQGGLKADDLITAVNGKPVHAKGDVKPLLEPLPPGSKVTFEIDRGGQKQTVQVTLGKRPPQGERHFEQFGDVPENLPEPSGGGPSLGAPSKSDPPSGAAPPTFAPGGGPRPVPSAHVAAAEPPTESPTDAVRRPLLGVRTQTVTEEVRRRLHFPGANGAWVVARTAGSPATKAGIPLDAVITAIDGAAVDSPQTLSRIVGQAGAGHQIEVTFFAEGQSHRVKLQLADFTHTAASPLPGPAPSREPPSLGPPADDRAARLEYLERRVQQLEERVRALEQQRK